MNNTAEWMAWKSMIRAAYHGTDQQFSKVGARGLGVHKPWRESFENFLRDAGPCPPGKSLRRIHEGLPFSPSNVEWK